MLKLPDPRRWCGRAARVLQDLPQPAPAWPESDWWHRQRHCQCPSCARAAVLLHPGLASRHGENRQLLGPLLVPEQTRGCPCSNPPGCSNPPRLEASRCPPSRCPSAVSSLPQARGQGSVRASPGRSGQFPVPGAAELRELRVPDAGQPGGFMLTQHLFPRSALPALMQS